MELDGGERWRGVWGGGAVPGDFGRGWRGRRGRLCLPWVGRVKDGNERGGRREVVVVVVVVSVKVWMSVA